MQYPNNYTTKYIMKKLLFFYGNIFVTCRVLKGR